MGDVSPAETVADSSLPVEDGSPSEGGRSVVRSEKKERKTQRRRSKRFSRLGNEEGAQLRVTYTCLTHSDAAYEALLEFLGGQVASHAREYMPREESPSEQGNQEVHHNPCEEDDDEESHRISGEPVIHECSRGK